MCSSDLAGRNVVTAYLAHGMVRRGNEIWQYYFGETQYHSTHKSDKAGRGVYRLVQRLDGFVSIDSPYGEDAVVTTRSEERRVGKECRSRWSPDH